MQVDTKYLKDNLNNIFSPVVSTDSVYDSNGENLTNLLQNLNGFSNTYDNGTIKCTYGTIGRIKYSFGYMIGNADYCISYDSPATDSDTFPYLANYMTITICQNNFFTNEDNRIIQLTPKLTRFATPILVQFSGWAKNSFNFRAFYKQMGCTITSDFILYFSVFEF